MKPVVGDSLGQPPARGSGMRGGGRFSSKAINGRIIKEPFSQIKENVETKQILKKKVVL